MLINVTQGSPVAITVLLYSWRCRDTHRSFHGDRCIAAKKWLGWNWICNQESELVQYHKNWYWDCKWCCRGWLIREGFFGCVLEISTWMNCPLDVNKLLEMESWALLTVNLKDLRVRRENVFGANSRQSQRCTHYCLQFSHWDFNHRLQYFWLMGVSLRVPIACARTHQAMHKGGL